jgi:hypothetical protein
LIDNQIEVDTDPRPAYGYQALAVHRPGEQLSIVVDGQPCGMIVVPDLFSGRIEG